jgi:hypothetical protein
MKITSSFFAMSDLGIAFKTDIDYTLATFKIEFIGFSLKLKQVTIGWSRVSDKRAGLLLRTFVISKGKGPCCCSLLTLCPK